MPRSVALTGLIIIVSLSMVGFAAFSSGGTVAPSGVDVPGIDASAAAAVFAAPLVPLAEPEPAAAPPPPQRAPLGRSALEPEAAATTTTSPPTTTTTTTAPPAPTTTKPPPTTLPPTTTTTTTVPPTTVPATTPTTAPPTATSWPPAVEQWRALVSDYFPESRVEEALAIISCESRGDASATNPTSGAAGLFQFIRSTWDWVAAETGLDSYSSGAPYDPTANTAAAAWLVQRSIETNHSGGPWGHWSCRRVLG